MYTNEDFVRDCLTLFDAFEGRKVPIPEVGERTLFEKPLIGFASAGDELFETFRRKGVIGDNYMGPYEWLPEARSVISLFFPIPEEIRRSNREDDTDPSREWLYARIEGQEFLNNYIAAIRHMFEEKGISACVPSLDERFGVNEERPAFGREADYHADSRWSERHAAYVCGLGTFGLSRGLITEKGMAGRFASIIVAEEFEPTARGYTGVDDYCIQCGACVRRCPANAISVEGGKNNVLCDDLLERIRKKYPPRYGCGKCQVGVPCESRIPLRQ